MSKRKKSICDLFDVIEKLDKPSTWVLSDVFAHYVVEFIGLSEKDDEHELDHEIRKIHYYLEHRCREMVGR